MLLPVARLRKSINIFFLQFTSGVINVLKLLFFFPLPPTSVTARDEEIKNNKKKEEKGERKKVFMLSIYVITLDRISFIFNANSHTQKKPPPSAQESILQIKLTKLAIAIGKAGTFVAAGVILALFIRFFIEVRKFGGCASVLFTFFFSSSYFFAFFFFVVVVVVVQS